MATVKIKVDLKEEERFLLSNEDAETLIDLCRSLEALEERRMNEVD